MAAPKYNILLQPQSANGTALSGLHVTVTLESPERKMLQLLFCFEPVGDYPPHPYTASSLRAKDDDGPLAMSLTTSYTGSLQCTPGRDTVGDVILALDVTPKAATVDDELVYPELCCDQGGLVGVGWWFLPRVPYRALSAYVVDWDLSLAPTGTRASWSLGEGEAQGSSDAKTGPNEMFLGAVFMVGPIVSFPAQEAAAASGDDDAVMPCIHWLGELPTCFEPVKRYNADIFRYVRSVFQDPDAINKVYIRKVPRGYAAYNFTFCYIIQYSDQDKPHCAAEVIHYMTHEMVHRWAYLGDELDGYQNLWFIEGIAEFYALYLPVRAGVMGIEYFCQVLDKFLMAYYTSPLVYTALRERPDNSDGFRLPYERGFIYLFLLEAQLRNASRAELTSDGDLGQQRNLLDPVVMSILEKHYAGELIDSTIWRQTLYPLLGKDMVDTHFCAMMDGHLLTPSDDDAAQQPIITMSGKQVNLRVVGQERLEIGFHHRSLDTGVVEGLVPGSRAETAGLRNGDKMDKMLARSAVGTCKEDLRRDCHFTVQRGEETLQIVYWPRSFAKVTSYQTVIVDEQA